MKRCLVCYNTLDDQELLYHPICSGKFFNSKKPPQLKYTIDQLNELAGQVIKSQISIPGVQTKLSLYLNKQRSETNRFTIVGLWGNYILKPPIPQFPYMPENEDLTMHLANIFKIPTVPHALIPLKSGELSYISRRIDRQEKGNKLFMEDMCQLGGRLTENKYNGSLEQVGKTIAKYSSNPLFDKIKFFEVVIFSFLTGNADMHLKNFSLIYPMNNMIQLSPAYDLLSTRLIIPEKSDPEEMALTLNGKKSNLNKKDFIKFAETLGISTKQIFNTFIRFNKQLDVALDFINISFLPEYKKKEYILLVKERANRIL
ncbi:HipA domain-containing protein [candidate division WOR-3 bacterium]|nr:HipA domain-containing protein [candidate division WOR-3 bacterium]